MENSNEQKLVYDSEIILMEEVVHLAKVQSERIFPVKKVTSKFFYEESKRKLQQDRHWLLF